MKLIFLIVGILIYGCGGSGDSCTKYIIDKKVLDYSDCGGFTDRNDTENSFENNKTYVSYEVDYSQKIIILNHYNAAFACNVTDNSNVNINNNCGLDIYYPLKAEQTCYCLKDVKIQFKDKYANTYYRVTIKDFNKADNDPEIDFIINIDKNSSGIVSFSRTTEPWIVQ